MRITAFDQSTNILGFSVFEDGKLKTYGVGDFKKYGDAPHRINQVKIQMLELIDKFQPDLVLLEDTQLESSPKVYKTLCKLLGVLEDALIESGTPYDVVPPSTWRATLSIKGKNREALKLKAIEYVEREFGITGDIDDIAESICIGFYGVKTKTA